MKLGVDITPELSVEVDLPPGAPVPVRVDLDWEARTEDELVRLVEVLGFDAAKMSPTNNLHVRYRLPLTRDGEQVGTSDVNLWLKGELLESVPSPPMPALARLVEAGKAAARERERQRVNAGAVEWAQGVGRDVELRNREVVEREGA